MSAKVAKIAVSVRLEAPLLARLDTACNDFALGRSLMVSNAIRNHLDWLDAEYPIEARSGAGIVTRRVLIPRRGKHEYTPDADIHGILQEMGH